MPSLHWLLLPAALTVAMAQDHNLYKDIQRGKVEELERFIRDEDYQIDHTTLTWPSTAARHQMPNSAKRTMNIFKNLKLQKPSEEEEESEEESQPNSSAGNEEETGTRVLIPRTHVLLREEPLKAKRGPLLWNVQLASFGRATKQPLHRDTFWMEKSTPTSPKFSTSANTLLLSFERCKLLKNLFNEFYHCV